VYHNGYGLQEAIRTHYSSRVGTQVSGVVRKKIFVRAYTAKLRRALPCRIVKPILLANFNARRNLPMTMPSIKKLNENHLRPSKNPCTYSPVITSLIFDDASYNYENLRRNSNPRVYADLTKGENQFKLCDIYSPIDGVVLFESHRRKETNCCSKFSSTPNAFLPLQKI